MLPIKGVFKDYHETKHPEGFALDIRNGVVYRGLYVNEEGTELHSQEFSNSNLTPICILPVKDGKKVVFSIREDGQDEIGILDKDGTYSTRIVADLGFDINYPIDAEAQYNYKNELVVAFTDGLNTPKIINLDDIQLPFDINSIELFPSFKEPILDVELVDGGGELASGSYQLFIQYKDYDNTVTSPSRLTQPTFITVSNQTDSFDSFTGVEANTPTNKAIRLIVNNVDTKYDKIVIGVLSKIDGVLTPMIVGEVKIVGTTASFVYTGGEAFADFTISEVLDPGIYYKTIKHLTQVGGALYGASVTEYEPVNLQKYANLIELRWFSYPMEVTEMEESYKLHENNNKRRGFAHGEVYAFYIRFKLKRGGWTQAFHIPGRVVQPLAEGGMENDLNSELRANFPSTDYQFLDRDESVNSTSRYYQTRDTTRNISASYFDDVNKSGFTGEFGFWENEDEVYPNTEDFAPVGSSPDLRGQKVRHHRFPSMSLAASLYSSDSKYGITRKDILGVEVNFFPSLPSELEELVEGYEIMYAERTASNSTIAGEGLVNYTENDNINTDSIIRWTAGGNYIIYKRVNDTNPPTLIPNYSLYRLYSFDLLNNKSSGLPTYIEPVYRFTKDNRREVGDNSYGHYHIGNKSHTNLNPPPQYSDVSVGWDFRYTVDTPRLTRSNTLFQEQVRPLSNTRFVPQNTISGQINNRNAEEVIVAELTDFAENGGLGIPISEFDYDNGTTIVYFSYDYGLYGVYKVYKKNAYIEFGTQRLVSTGSYSQIDSPSNRIYGGDVFLGLWSFVTHSNKLPDGPDGYVTTGIDSRFKFLREIITETRANTGFRYEDLSDIGTKFFPKTPLSGDETWFLQYLDEVTFNKIAYNNDYTSINNVNSAISYNPQSPEEFVEEDLYKIIRSQISSPEERNPSWRAWKANDYYIIPRDKGIITNIQGFGQNLFINTSASLFITTGNEVLATNESEVAVGTGDIFSRPLRELKLDKDGYTGCQHKFSCLLSVSGYFFIDVEKGRIFMSDGNDVRDIGTGMTDFFRENLTAEEDNPFKGTGYTVGWDDKYGRIILAKISGTPFTWSYTVNMGSWTSWHDYRPNYLYNDRKDLYALKDKEVFVHNRENYGQYYRDEIKPFHIVGVINDSSNIDKLLGNINWRTQVNLTDEQLFRDKTFDEILIWNRYQSTGDTPLEPNLPIRQLYENQDIANTRRAKDKWNFNRIRDLVRNNSLPFIEGVNSIELNIDRDKELQYRRRLIDTFFVYKLLFNNQKMTNLNQEELSAKIQVLDIDWKIKPVRR